MEWLQLVEDHGLHVVFTLFLLLLIIKLVRVILDEDKSSLFRARIYKSIFFFSNRRNHEKIFISNDIKGRLNFARKKLPLSQILLPRAVKVEWIDGEDPGPYDISEGEFIVCLDPLNKQEKNIVCLAQALVQKTSLIGIRRIIDKPLKNAFDVTLTKRLLHKTKHNRSIDWFHSNVIKNIAKTGGLAELWYSKVAEIDDQGLFNILLLVELEDYGRRIGGKEPRPYMFGQIEYAVNFIHNIATKKEGIEVKLDFIRTHIKLKIILVERADAILEQGIKPYVDAIKIALDCVEAFYLIILQKDYLKLKNIEGFFNYRRLCKDLAMEIESLPGVSKHFEVPSYEYSDPNGIHREGKLIRYLVDLERTGNSEKL